MNTASRSLSLSLMLTSPLLGFASDAPPFEPPAGHAGHGVNYDPHSPLVDTVRHATEAYRDINAASAAGFVQGTPCVSGPDFGAMGVHYVMPARINGAVLNAEQPEALIYEPQASGALRLVGVESIILADLWKAKHPTVGLPVLEGHLMNYVAAPNRYGLPAFYELHVWAWAHNPVGSFADWNSQVSCDHQSPN